MSGVFVKLRRFRSSKCGFSCTRIRRLSESKRYAPPPPENPVRRTLRILGDDVKTSFGFKKQTPLFPHHCDIVIIGGGVIGSSVAYWLQQRALDGLSIVVVEKDPSYATSSTVLSCGGLRQQFTLPENIEMSLYGAEFLRNINTHLSVPDYEVPNVQFTPCGYTFLAAESDAELLEDNVKLQRKLGAKIELLTADKLKNKFPWMNLDGIVLASHGIQNEGWVDPWSVLVAYKRKAMSLGTMYVKGEAVDFEFKNLQDVIVDGMPRGAYDSLDRLLVKTEDGSIKPIKFAIAVIAAGCNSSDVAKLARIGTGPQSMSIALPVVPRKRYVYVFHCPEGPGLNAPCLVDPSGVFFRRAGLGGNYICGISPQQADDEPSCDNLDVDYALFEDKILPLLSHRVPAFKNVKLKSAWAGYYDYNEFDENPVIGPHPNYHNLYITSGFSDRGVMHAAATGRAVMEMIVDGGFQTIDMSRLCFERILGLDPLQENNIL